MQTIPPSSESTSKEPFAEQASPSTKYRLARQFIEKLLLKFSRTIDEGIFKELDRIIAYLDAFFVHHRSAHHFVKMAYSVFFIRRKIARDLNCFPSKERVHIRLFPSQIYFDFGSKPILSVLVHACLKNKYEIVDENSILCLIQELIPEAQLVKDSSYVFQPTRKSVKTVYFEISKASGSAFTSTDITYLRRCLKHTIQSCIEQVVPRIFMVRNEEETFKSIVTLSREIQSLKDMPQVMILLEDQSTYSVTFTIILVRALYSLQSDHPWFFHPDENVQYFPDRRQIIRYLDKKYPVEARVFRLQLEKDVSLLRVDNSLNFYTARQRVSGLLEKAIGEFRDYNGGIIIQQHKTLTDFKESFQNLSLRELHLLEIFYYSLSPLEVQATLPIESLKTFFKIFLEAKNAHLNNQSDVFFGYIQEKDLLYVMIGTLDRALQQTLEKIFSSLIDISILATSVTGSQQACFLGYLIQTTAFFQDQILENLQANLKKWRENIGKKQILTIALEPRLISLDPRVGGDQVSSLVLRMLFEGLMRIGKNGAVEYGIAKKVDISPDCTDYIFTLREAFWSNGDLISAFDFEYAWKKILSPSFKTPFAYLFYTIKNAKRAKFGMLPTEAIGIKALDDNTLQVKLEAPAPYFLELTAHTIYSPIHSRIDAQHPNWPFEEKEKYIGCGAFQLINNASSERYELIKNPLYWDAQNIQLESINILKANRQQSSELFQKGSNHWLGLPLGTVSPLFTPTAQDESVAFFDNTVFWCVFNSQIFPFNNQKLRKAFSLAINRFEISTLTNLVPAFSPLPPLHSQTSNSIITTFKLDKAKLLFNEALKEMNLSLKDFPEISIIYLAGDIKTKVVDLMIRTWKAAFNISCTMEALEWNVLFDRITEGPFQIGALAWESWISDPLYTLNTFREANDLINFPKWENSTYQHILQLADTEPDPQKRKSYYLQAEDILLEECPVTSIYSITYHAFKKKNLCVHLSYPIDFKWSHFS